MAKAWGIVINTIFLGIGALVSFLSAIGLAAYSAMGMMTTAVVPYSGVFVGAAFVAILLAVVYAVLAYYLWIENNAAWWIVSIVAILGLFSAFFAMFYSGFAGIVALAIQAALVLGLLHKDTIAAINPLKAVDIDWKGWSLEEG